MEEHQSSMRTRDLDRDSGRNYSDETDFHKKKGGTHDHNNKHVSSLALNNSNAYRRNASNSDDDIASFDELKSRKAPLEKHRYPGKPLPVSSKRESIRHQHRDQDVERFSSELEDDEMADLSYPARRHEKQEKRPKDGEFPSVKLSRQSSKRTEDSKSVHVSGSGGDSHSSRHRSSKRTNFDGGKYDVVDYEDEGKEFVRSGKHVRGRSSRSPPTEEVGRLHVNEISGSEVDPHRDHETIREVEKHHEETIRDVEKPSHRRRKHRSHSKSSKAELLGPTVSDQSDEDNDLKKKKRKHKKHHDEGSVLPEKSRERDGRSDADGDHGSNKHRKHKSKNGSHGIASSSPADLERTRWQLDSGHDVGTIVSSHSHRSKHSKHRRTENGKVK